MQAQPVETQARAQAEADFHDARINTPGERRLAYAYASVADVYAFGGVPGECLDRSLLEIGCFRGEQALALDGFRGTFRGIDISPAAVAHCTRLGLPSNFQFQVDDANVLATVADASIDYAFGHGVLHHLELGRFAPALARKLRAGGYARFVEPAQGNVLLRAFRSLTPRLRTPDEHPFDRGSIEVLQRHFDVRITYQALLRPYLPMLFFNNSAVTRLSRWAEARLLRRRFFRSQAWLLQIELRARPA